MIHDSDFIRLTDRASSMNYLASDFGVTEWPPPRLLVRVEDETWKLFERVSYSEITDEQIARMTNVARGAEFVCIVRNDEPPHQAPDAEVAVIPTMADGWKKW